MVDWLNDLKPSVREMPIDVFVEALSDEGDIEVRGSNGDAP